MTPTDFLLTIIGPGLTALYQLGGPVPSGEAERFMLAIALQENGPDLRARYQSSPNPVGGPAKGWFQFEPAGCEGVLTHRASRQLCQLACSRYHIVPHAAPLCRALEGHDIMSAIMARLLIFTHPKPLPVDRDDGWDQYIFLWRPGKPRQQSWFDSWRVATETIL